MSFVPNAQTSEIVLFVRLISAMALFSCKVTQAFWESALMVMYSGSKSWDNVLVDSGLKGTFTEYDVDHKAIVTYKMDYEKFIYRVFKYKFDGFYFEKSE